MAPLGLRSIIIRSPMRQFSQKKKLTLIWFFCVCFVCHRFGKNRRERKLRSSVIFRTRHKKNLRQPPKEKEEKVGSDPQKMEGALRFLYSGAKGNQKLLLRWTGHTQKKKYKSYTQLHKSRGSEKKTVKREGCQATAHLRGRAQKERWDLKGLGADQVSSGGNKTVPLPPDFSLFNL